MGPGGANFGNHLYRLATLPLAIVIVAPAGRLMVIDAVGALPFLALLGAINVRAGGALVWADTDAETLEEFAIENGVAVLAIGAFGHSSFRKAVFGGIARMLLDKARLPILLSR